MRLGRLVRVHFVRQLERLFNLTRLVPAAESSQTDSQLVRD